MKEITEDYVSFETAKLLKEKGFDYISFYCYEEKGPNDILTVILSAPLSNSDLYNTIEPHKCYSAPTLQMAMKWLRKHSWVICVIPLTFYCGEVVSEWGYNIWADDNLEIDKDNTPKFNKYEQACEAAIKYCLEKLI